MLLQLATWPEIEAYLQRSTGIIVPIGSTEQHGPNGLIGTDAICADTLARGVSKGHDVLVAPPLNYGMAQHHLGFAGTISLRPLTLIHVIKDVIAALRVHGFTHIYFLNGHGGNEAATTAAFSEIYAETSFQEKVRPVRCKLRNWWTLPAVGRFSKERYGRAEGHHATPSEVSLSYYAHPEAVKDVALSPELAPDGMIYDALDYRRQFPDGRIGSNPALASIEAGKELLQIGVDGVYKDYLAFLGNN